jgi:hypothetical protein
MKVVTTNSIAMRNCGGVVVVARNRRGYWFSSLKRTIGQQEEIV